MSSAPRVDGGVQAREREGLGDGTPRQEVLPEPDVGRVDQARHVDAVRLEYERGPWASGAGGPVGAALADAGGRPVGGADELPGDLAREVRGRRHAPGVEVEDAAGPERSGLGLDAECRRFALHLQPQVRDRDGRRTCREELLERDRMQAALRGVKLGEHLVGRRLLALRLAAPVAAAGLGEVAAGEREAHPDAAREDQLAAAAVVPQRRQLDHGALRLALEHRLQQASHLLRDVAAREPRRPDRAPRAADRSLAAHLDLGDADGGRRQAAVGDEVAGLGGLKLDPSPDDGVHERATQRQRRRGRVVRGVEAGHEQAHAAVRLAAPRGHA